MHGNNRTKIKWPDNKDFTFTIFDDTDLQTEVNVRNIYELLKNLGFRTTKSVWPQKGNKEPIVGGSTCEDFEYLNWVKDLKNDGFEIGYHSNTYHRSTREEVITGLERFKELFGRYPISMAQHTDHEECDALYWGENRLSPGIYRWIYNTLTRGRYKNIFNGHVEGNRYFWGDICKNKIKYVRNFVFSEINTLKACPSMPYHDPDRPFVKYWFASSEGGYVNSFIQCLSEKNQDQLEEDGGACIMYTHFANNFSENGSINPRYKFLMERLSKKNGWFVPVSTLLDYLLKVRGDYEINKSERTKLERKWLLHKMAVGGTS